MPKVIQVRIFLKTGVELSGPELPCEDVAQTRLIMSEVLARSETLRITSGKTFHHIIPVSSIDYVTIEEITTNEN